MCKQFVFLVFLCFSLKATNSYPFLFNSGKEILSSIFSSSAHPNDQGTGNIEVIKGAKTPHKTHMRSLQQSDEEEEEEVQEEDNREPVEIDEISKNNPPPKNSSSSSIIHHKIGKIFKKLQLYSAVRNTLHPQELPEETSDEEFKGDENEITRHIKLLVGKNETGPDVSTQPPTKATPQPPTQPPPSKITLYPPEESASAEETTPTPPSDDGKISLSAGNLGVYFMELLGGLATLIYGAAMQVANLGANLGGNASGNQETENV